MLKKFYWAYHRLRGKEQVWNFLNRKSRKFWQEQKITFSEKEKNIVETLKKDGIASIHINELFGKGAFEELKKYTDYIWNSPHIQNDVLQERMRDIAEGKHKKGEKYFFVFLDGEEDEKELDLANPFIKFTLDDKILRIAGGYLGLAPRFDSFSLRATMVIPPSSTPYLSQRWHRDPDDKKMLKVFLYLTDVLEEGAGPFNYVLGSHYGGKWRDIFPQIPPVGAYPPVCGVEKIVPKSDIKTCLAPAGTLIFADTSGLHKGGFSTTKTRIMSISDFVSHASKQGKRYLLPKKNEILVLSPLAKNALTF